MEKCNIIQLFLRIGVKIYTFRESGKYGGVQNDREPKAYKTKKQRKNMIQNINRQTEAARTQRNAVAVIIRESPTRSS